MSEVEGRMTGSFQEVQPRMIEDTQPQPWYTWNIGDESRDDDGGEGGPGSAGEGNSSDAGGEGISPGDGGEGKRPPVVAPPIIMIRQLTDGHGCPVCVMNESQGWIPYGTTFYSGHTEVPIHEHCDCRNEFDFLPAVAAQPIQSANIPIPTPAPTPTLH